VGGDGGVSPSDHEMLWGLGGGDHAVCILCVGEWKANTEKDRRVVVHTLHNYCSDYYHFLPFLIIIISEYI